MALLAAVLAGARPADLGNGTYRNPVLFADYSDPDVIRVGADYYLVSSSFHFMPGIPILKSHDLVNWTIIGHVYQRLELDPKYSMVGGTRYAGGSWAPAIRFHQGRFYVYFPTPDEGILMSSAKSAEGPWTSPVLVLAKKGLEDPCPFWDDDGSAYLVHSVVGAGPLILHRMNPEGTAVLDEGKEIARDPKTLPTLEGPKFYKRRGYYYIFAPIGGVSAGQQAVLRSKSIYGPYEYRIVLAQAATAINGPHQGAYVETPSGEGWFLHFQHRGAYGRIVHMQPVRWVDDWPVMGEAGQPVATARKPDVGKTYPILEPQTSDEFNSRQLGLQWEWNHNPDDAHWSLSQRPGFLRLHAMPAADLLSAQNTLTLTLQDPALYAEALLDVTGMTDGQQAGLGMFIKQPHWIGVAQAGGRRRLILHTGAGETPGPALETNQVELRVHVENEAAAYSYSLDGGKTFLPLGEPMPIVFSWWKGARICLLSFTDKGSEPGGYVDIDWLHYQAAP
ncbi:MAG: glycoside hydrolase 43 family protein [Acidobacteriia bacterium]|nr:glycoside hydrolase 43 family protein [Terriglobia bacterium]